MSTKSLEDKITKEILDKFQPTEEASTKVKKENSIKDATEFLKSKGKRMSFPIDAFPDHIQELLTDWTKSTNIPVEYFGTAVLVAASVAIGNKIQLKITPTWYEAPIIYAAIIGPNGIGKSPVWRFALSPIKEIAKRYNEEHQQNMQNFYLNLAQSKKKNSNAEPPPKRTILIQKTTMEYIMECLFLNPHGLLLFRDELKGWLLSMNQYRGGDDLESWLEIFNNDDLSKDNKSGSFFIARCFVSILGAIQPKLIKALATSNNIANGLYQRFLFAYPYAFRRSSWSESEPDPHLLKTYKEIIIWIHNLQDRIEVPDDRFGDAKFTAMKIVFSKEAKTNWVKFYNWVSSQYNNLEDENAAGILSKHDRYCARIALILRMLRYAIEELDLKSEEIEPESTEGLKVEKEDVQNAIKLSRYFIHQSHRILEDMDTPVTGLKPEYQFWYKALPETFVKEEARTLINDLADSYKEEFKKELKISHRTLARLLNNKMATQPIFQRDGRGYYRKLWEL